MTRVAVTSQVRFAGQTAYSGFFRVVDLDTGSVSSVSPVSRSTTRKKPL